jgi:hypothetical protein
MDVLPAAAHGPPGGLVRPDPRRPLPGQPVDESPHARGGPSATGCQPAFRTGSRGPERISSSMPAFVSLPGFAKASPRERRPGNAGIGSRSSSATGSRSTPRATIAGSPGARSRPEAVYAGLRSESHEVSLACTTISRSGSPRGPCGARRALPPASRESGGPLRDDAALAAGQQAELPVGRCCRGVSNGASGGQFQKPGKHRKPPDAASGGGSRGVLPHGLQKIGGSNLLAPPNPPTPQDPLRTRVPSGQQPDGMSLRTLGTPFTKRSTARGVSRDCTVTDGAADKGPGGPTAWLLPRPSALPPH